VRIFSVPAALLLVRLLSASPAPALDAKAKAEIDHLIEQVERSGYRFIRGGKEHTAAEGAEHLRTKLHRAGARAKTTEDSSKELPARATSQVRLTW
jgi:hypothetical protein